MSNASDTDISSKAAVVLAITDGLSAALCLVAASLVFVFRLYTKVFYRLALYQVLSSLAFAIVEVLQIVFITPIDDTQTYDGLCKAMAWAVVYTQWMKLLFTVWVTIHLFSFAVFHKSLDKLEALYVVSSLTAPALMACIPLITGSYGHSSLGSCYIYAANDTRHVAAIEWFAVWHVPAVVILLAASAAMGVMVVKLANAVRLRPRAMSDAHQDQFWKALKQVLPLAAFPLLFFIFIIPVFVFGALATEKQLTADLELVAAACISLWSMASGITLIVHIALARRRPKQKSVYSPDGEREYHTLTSF